MSKLFSYDGVVKCLNFKKVNTASYTGKNDGLLFKEYFKQNVITAVFIQLSFAD